MLKSYLVAILIALVCVEFSSAELLNKLKEKTETKRDKRALYYQNDLISNEERELRKLYPLGGGILPIYDYAYPFVDPFLVDPFLVDPFLVDPFLVDPLLVDPFLVDPLLVDPLLVGPSFVDPLLVDPLFGVDPLLVDPRFGGVDPRFGVDPLLVDPRFGVDPFLVDPRFGVDPLLVDPRVIDPFDPFFDPRFGSGVFPLSAKSSSSSGKTSQQQGVAPATAAKRGQQANGGGSLKTLRAQGPSPNFLRGQQGFQQQAFPQQAFQQQQQFRPTQGFQGWNQGQRAGYIQQQQQQQQQQLGQGFKPTLQAGGLAQGKQTSSQNILNAANAAALKSSQINSNPGAQ